MTRNDRFVYRFEGAFSGMDLIGPVADGLRLNGHFGGPVTAGRFTGGQVTGIDYFRVRNDGIGVIDAQEILSFDGHQVAVEVHGYLQPPEGLPAATPEQIASADFVWPDAPFAIEAFATFQTAAPELADLNATIVAHSGWVNMGTGRLFVEAHRIEQPRGRRGAGDLAAASA